MPYRTEHAPLFFGGGTNSISDLSMVCTVGDCVGMRIKHHLGSKTTTNHYQYHIFLLMLCFLACVVSPWEGYDFMPNFVNFVPQTNMHVGTL